jgi:hypothetical protein
MFQVFERALAPQLKTFASITRFYFTKCLWYFGFHQVIRLFPSLFFVEDPQLIWKSQHLSISTINQCLHQDHHLKASFDAQCVKDLGLALVHSKYVHMNSPLTCK